jgi:citrate synthase
MNDSTWSTSITQIKPNEIRIRGFRVEELMGKITFTEAIGLILTGEIPDEKVTRMLDAILVSSIDHGVTPPSTQAARDSATTGAPMNASLAAGILSINRYHGGAIADCMEMIQDSLCRCSEDNPKSCNSSSVEIARELIISYQASKKRLPGFGHRVHSKDPRTTRLFMLAEELGIAQNGVAMIKTLQNVIGDTGKELTINVDGAIAAVLVDMGIPNDLANAFFIMARLPGLVAHVYEEQTTQPPMRDIDVKLHRYNGPEDRNYTDEKHE